MKPNNNGRLIPIALEGVDVDEKPLDLNEIRKKAYPDV